MSFAVQKLYRKYNFGIQKTGIKNFTLRMQYYTSTVIAFYRVKEANKNSIF